MQSDQLLYTFRNERTGIRDRFYMDRHGLYGKCSAIDMDFIELDRNLVAKLGGDLKHSSIQTIDRNDWQAKAYKNNFNFPLIFLVYYFFNTDNKLMSVNSANKNISSIQYFPIPINVAAMKLFGREGVMITEQDWIKFLYHIRKQKIDFDISGFSDTIKPVSEPVIKGEI